MCDNDEIANMHRTATDESKYMFERIESKMTKAPQKSVCLYCGYTLTPYFADNKEQAWFCLSCRVHFVQGVTESMYRMSHNLAKFYPNLVIPDVGFSTDTKAVIDRAKLIVTAVLNVQYQEIYAGECERCGEIHPLINSGRICDKCIQELDTPCAICGDRYDLQEMQTCHYCGSSCCENCCKYCDEGEHFACELCLVRRQKQ